MPAGRFKSRTFRRVKSKLPGGRVTTHYKKRRPARAKCAVCGSLLMAVPNLRPFRMKKLQVSKKRPERPFGGNLCSACTRSYIRAEARKSLV